MSTLEMALVLIAAGCVANTLSWWAAIGDWRAVRGISRYHVHRVQAVEIVIAESITLTFQVTLFCVRLWALTCWPPFESPTTEHAWLIDVCIVTAAQTLLASKSIVKLYLRRKKRLILEGKAR